MTFTAVPYGMGRRVGIDRDDDMVFDRTELESGSDPRDVRSPSTLPPPEDFDFNARIDFCAYPGQHFEAPLASGGRFRGNLLVPLHPNNVITFEIIDPLEAPPGLALAVW